MSWVLLIFLVGPAGTTSQAIAYPSETTCEAAKQRIAERETTRGWGISTLCLPGQLQ